MSNRYAKRHGMTSWLFGVGVLISVAVAVTWMFYESQRRSGEMTQVSAQAGSQGAAASQGTAGGSGEGKAKVLPRLMGDASARSASVASGELVRGVVKLPEGLPAAGATVTPLTAC